SLVDDRHFGRSQVVMLVKIAPGQKDCLHRLEVTRSCPVEHTVLALSGRSVRPSVLIPTATAHRRPPNLRRRNGPGASPHSVEDLTINLRQTALRIMGRTEIHADGNNPFGPES